MASVEKRKRPRRRISLSGIVTWGLGSKYFPCTILDLTPDGARITVPDRPLLPSELQLINIKGQYAQRALVAWVKGSEAGLKFVDYIDLSKGGAISSPHLVKLLVKHTAS